MTETGLVVLYGIRRRFLVLAYALWLIVGTLGVHRLYVKNVKAFSLQFILGFGTYIFIFLSAVNPDNFFLEQVSTIAAIILFFWLIVDIYWIYRWVKIFNISLYRELFVGKKNEIQEETKS